MKQISCQIYYSFLSLDVFEKDIMLSGGHVAVNVSKFLQYAYIFNLFEVVVT